MKVADFTTAALQRELFGPGLNLVTGPLSTRIRTRIPSVGEGIATLYADFTVKGADEMADFTCSLRAPRSLRRWYRPQVLFLADGRSVFKPLSYHQAYPMLEWGMNWCVASQVWHALVIHAAAVVKEGRALIMPAPPGSGKSTLCAGLVCRGWRLLTDESVLVDPDRGTVQGPARPVSLKNASIDVIRAFASDAVLGQPCHDTLKGRVSHLKPPVSSVESGAEPAVPAWLVFPRYEPGAETRLVPRRPGSAFLALAGNAFNYAALGRAGFYAAADLVDQVESYDFVYSSLDEAVELFDELAG